MLAVGLFASIVLHELAHTLVAIRFDGRVRSITLMLLGGVSPAARGAHGRDRPGDEPRARWTALRGYRASLALRPDLPSLAA